MTIFRYVNGESIYTPERLIEIWPHLDEQPELVGDARAYYEVCSVRTEAGYREFVERSDDDVTNALNWPQDRVEAAIKALGDIARPHL